MRRRGVQRWLVVTHGRNDALNGRAEGGESPGERVSEYMAREQARSTFPWCPPVSSEALSPCTPQRTDETRYRPAEAAQNKDAKDETSLTPSRSPSSVSLEALDLYPRSDTQSLALGASRDTCPMMYPLGASTGVKTSASCGSVFLRPLKNDRSGAM